MAARRRSHVLCIHCDAILTIDDRTYYVCSCHDCAMREHDVARLAAQDPDHPDVISFGEPPLPWMRRAAERNPPR